MARIRPLAPGEAARTLAQRLAPTVDRIRQISTNLGARPYRVFLRWTRWDGRVRGDGNEHDLFAQEILPTPKVASLDAVTFSLFHSGTIPEGSVRVTEISAAVFSEDVLRGVALPRITEAGDECGPELRRMLQVDFKTEGGDGSPTVPPNLDFFWEVVEDDRSGAEPRRSRFRLLNKPFLQATRVQWTVMLERAGADRTRDNRSPFALGSGR